MRMRRVGRGVAVSVAAVGLALGVQGQAQAAATLSIPGGYGLWSPDPSNGDPGDAIKACDTEADNWGIQVQMDIHKDGTYDRIATTRGHGAGYCSDWETGNIAEGTVIRIYVIQVRGDDTNKWSFWDVTA